MTELQRSLFELQDLKYRDFQSKLLPKTEKEKIIGVRTPILRKFAKEFAQTKEAQKFLQELPHQYYEENNLHLMLVTQIRDYKKCLKEVTQFLPYIDNWATCDLPLPKCFEKHKAELIVDVKNWIASNDTYTIRYGIGVLLRLYLDEDFKDEYPKLVSAVISDEYYVNMMIAWYFATALAKQYDSTVPFVEERRLSPWVHNKTIQKAVESFRITAEQKAHLKTLRLNLRRRGAKNEPVLTSKSDSNESKRIEVVAAIIEKDGKILICRRAENKTRALKWEFPGGKIEPGETPERAVLRECREELDVDLCVKGEFMRVLHSYPDIEIQLTVFRTAIIGRDPRCIEHKEIRFVYPSELADFELCPADITVAEKIISEAHLF